MFMFSENSDDKTRIKKQNCKSLNLIHMSLSSVTNWGPKSDVKKVVQVLQS